MENKMKSVATKRSKNIDHDADSCQKKHYSLRKHKYIRAVGNNFSDIGSASVGNEIKQVTVELLHNTETIDGGTIESVYNNRDDAGIDNEYNLEQETHKPYLDRDGSDSTTTTKKIASAEKVKELSNKLISIKKTKSKLSIKKTSIGQIEQLISSNALDNLVNERATLKSDITSNHNTVKEIKKMQSCTKKTKDEFTHKNRELISLGIEAGNYSYENLRPRLSTLPSMSLKLKNNENNDNQIKRKSNRLKLQNLKTSTTEPEDEKAAILVNLELLKVTPCYMMNETPLFKNICFQKLFNNATSPGALEKLIEIPSNQISKMNEPSTEFLKPSVPKDPREKLRPRKSSTCNIPLTKIFTQNKLLSKLTVNPQIEPTKSNASNEKPVKRRSARLNQLLRNPNTNPRQQTGEKKALFVNLQLVKVTPHYSTKEPPLFKNICFQKLFNNDKLLSPHLLFNQIDKVKVSTNFEKSLVSATENICSMNKSSENTKSQENQTSLEDTDTTRKKIKLCRDSEMIIKHHPELSSEESLLTALQETNNIWLKSEENGQLSGIQNLAKTEIIEYPPELSSEAIDPLSLPQEAVWNQSNKNGGSYSYEEQKALFERSDLFNGVLKERVCYYSSGLGMTFEILPVSEESGQRKYSQTKRWMNRDSTT
ncbi:uncharacterized protein [Diabrotica undecimpunctata]